MQDPLSRIEGNDVEFFPTQNATSGGSRDTLKNDWQVRPTGAPLCHDEMTVMPEQKWAKVSRNP